MNAADAQPTWTTRKLLAWTTEFFERQGLESPRLQAEMLLAHVLGTERLKLYMDPDRPATGPERSAYRKLVERAAAHEPVDYLVGWTPFFSMSLKVTPAVLVPRPSTEALVEHVVQHARRTAGFAKPTIADVGTGSGAIAIALAKHIPESRVVATDIRPDALAVARENAEAQGVAERIEFREGNLLEPLAGERFRYLVSNPPYIPDAEWEAVEPNVKRYEPEHALRGGADGLDYLRPMIAGAKDHLETPGQIAFEIAAVQEQAVIELAVEAGLAGPRVLKDDEGHPRVLVAERS
ncbi:MAG: peptide chain release factor N(5)-glutamine methyltransferase [Phycisphaeraceae bacterium]